MSWPGLFNCAIGFLLTLLELALSLGLSSRLLHFLPLLFPRVLPLVHDLVPGLGLDTRSADPQPVAPPIALTTPNRGEAFWEPVLDWKDDDSAEITYSRGKPEASDFTIFDSEGRIHVMPQAKDPPASRAQVR